MLESSEYDFRYDMCVGLIVDSIIDRDKLINTIALYYTVVRCKAQVDQLTEGLRVLGILELMKENPNKAKDLLIYKEPEHLTADKIISMFSSRLSSVGSNSREDEEQIVLFWVHFLQLIESKYSYVCVAEVREGHWSLREN